MVLLVHMSATVALTVAHHEHHDETFAAETYRSLGAVELIGR